MKPNFFCIGAQKAGTTTLHDILKEHDQIFLPTNKEAHFFDKEDRYQKGFQWYLNTFYEGSDEEKAIGSFTPNYLYFPEVPKRISEQLGPGIKFIVVLRNPVDRAVSQYQMNRFRGMETENDFLEAIKNEEYRIKNSASENNHFSYMSRGLYSKQLREYLKYYPIENFLFLIFEKEIKENIADTIVRVQKFLKVDVRSLDSTVKSNKAKSPKSFYVSRFLKRKTGFKSALKFFMPSDIGKRLKTYFIKTNRSDKKIAPVIGENERKEILNNYFDQDIKELEKLTGLDLKVWYNGA